MPTASVRLTRRESTRSWRGVIRDMAGLLTFHLLVLIAATWPAVCHLDAHLVGSPIDNVHELAQMHRFERAGSQEGAVPSLSERAFGVLRPVVGSGVTAYNGLWLGGLVLYGVGASMLVRALVPHTAAAALGGMLAMLSGPVLLRARGPLDTLGLAGMAWLLAAWVRFLDRSSWRWLAASVILLAVTMTGSEPLALYAMIPAVVLTVGATLRCEGPGSRAERWRLLAGLGLCLIVMEGVEKAGLVPWTAGARPTDATFAALGAPVWSYVLPTSLHRSIVIAPVDFYLHAGLMDALAEKASYLGIVTLGLWHVAYVRRARLPLGRWVIAAGLAAVVLSCGTAWQLWSWTVPLPGRWLREAGGLFGWVGIPSRFSLAVSLLAAIVAAAGARELLLSCPRIGQRAVLFLMLTGIAVLDLGTSPFPTFQVPERSPAVARLLQSDPEAVWVEAPVFASDPSGSFSGLDLWRPVKGDKSHVASSNTVDLRCSPFQVASLIEPGYLENTSVGSRGFMARTSFNAYVWGYLHARGARYVVIHKWLMPLGGGDATLTRLRSALAPGIVDEDSVVLVVDREQLLLPGHPIVVSGEGWTCLPDAPADHAYASEGALWVYVPETGTWDVRLGGQAQSMRQPRRLRLLDAAGEELAGWDLAADQEQTLATGPLTLSAGWHTLRLVGERMRVGNREEPPSARRFGLAGLHVESSQAVATAEEANGADRR